MAKARAVANGDLQLQPILAKPTARQKYLMTFAGPQTHLDRGAITDCVSFWRVSGYGTQGLTRAYEYARTAETRLPSQQELDRMIAAGWLELLHDPLQCTTDTKTGATTFGKRVWLTAAGKKAQANG